MGSMATDKSNSIKHSIGVASRRTGLKPDVIRAWEKRFGAVEPGRTSTNRRFYTDEQVERLLLLRQATLAGRQISQVAGLETGELRELAEKDREALSRVPRPGGYGPPVAEGDHLSACLQAIEELDSQSLRDHLEKAAAAMPQRKLFEELIVPLVERIGCMWEEGSIRIVHEHMATAAIRAFLENLQAGVHADEGAPWIVIGVPLRQTHEIGALMACNTAASEGWGITYLGQGLSAEEFAAAAVQKQASAVALSVVYPVDDPYLPAEFKKLRRLLGEEVEIIVGGRGSAGYMDALEEISARVALGAEDFQKILRGIRN